MKSTLFRTVFGVFAGAALLWAGAAQASTLTSAQVQSILQMLQSFGADQTTINNVSASLGSPTNPSPTTPGYTCPSPALSYNLYLGLKDAQTGGQVSQLQKFFGMTPTGYFGPLTRQAVMNFQQTNHVSPVTGGVGPLTRAFINNSICGTGEYNAPTPIITSITPTQGPVGTQITINGQGFTADNTVHFGSGGALHVPAQNGRGTLSFTIPSAVGPCSYVGDTSPIRCMIADQQVVPGNYSIYVTNTNGQSATQTFTVTSGQTGLLLQITSPATGQTFVRGQDMPIVWTIGQNAPSSANLVLDLYTEAGSKVGTIAIPQITADSYTWHIPGFPQNYMCTMQYPNGLCGSDIPTGQYYIKATATADGFNPNAAVYATAQSGVFTINLQ